MNDLRGWSPIVCGMSTAMTVAATSSPKRTSTMKARWMKTTVRIRSRYRNMEKPMQRRYKGRRTLDLEMSVKLPMSYKLCPPDSKPQTNTSGLTRLEGADSDKNRLADMARVEMTAPSMATSNVYRESMPRGITAIPLRPAP